jgi:TonB family protein
MGKAKLTKEEREGLIFSVTIHGMIILLSLFLTVGPKPANYTFMAVSIGAFEDGSPTDQVAEKVKEVATDPNPQNTPVKEIPKETTKIKEKSSTKAKPVEAPKQKNVTNDDIIKTPEAKKVDPKATADASKANPSTATSDVKSDRRTEGAKPEDGTQRDAKNAAFEINWAGDFKRAAISTPKPIHEGEDGVIMVQIEVLPNGTVGPIRLLRKASQTLENQVRRALRNWRFEALPRNAPQENQRATITFRFTT